MTGLPQHLASFAAENADGAVTAIDRSWPRDNSSVWELVSASGSRFYLKQHPTSRFHEREVTAYRLWVPHLSPDRAPVLLAADARLRGCGPAVGRACGGRGGRLRTGSLPRGAGAGRSHSEVADYGHACTLYLAGTGRETGS